jgi:hypothetical protein
MQLIRNDRNTVYGTSICLKYSISHAYSYPECVHRLGIGGPDGVITQCKHSNQQLERLVVSGHNNGPWAKSERENSVIHNSEIYNPNGKNRMLETPTNTMNSNDNL